ncbi:hypothetical protein V8D89_015049 [Ganoderma adspersum]
MSSATEPPRKRARVEDGNGETTSHPRKDDEVWLSDGSIVVVTADNVAFRVHKSTLARRSEIFSDLFSLSNADRAALSFARVSDSSDDIRHLFLVLCCGRNYYYDRDALILVRFEVLASLIRMAHKYAVRDVLEHALSRLQRYYTNDLAAWRDFDSRARLVVTKPEHAPTVVELARLTNTPALLPTAFLICTELLTSYRQPRVGGPLEFKVAALPVPDQAVLIAAKGYLINVCAERTLCLLAAIPCPGCTRPAACRAAKEAPLVALRNGTASWAPLFYEHDPFQPMTATFWDEGHWSMFCGSCWKSLTNTDEVETKWAWSGLPGMFGVKIDEDGWPGAPAEVRRETVVFGPRHM